MQEIVWRIEEGFSIVVGLEILGITNIFGSMTNLVSMIFGLLFLYLGINSFDLSISDNIKQEIIWRISNLSTLTYSIQLIGVYPAFDTVFVGPDPLIGFMLFFIGIQSLAYHYIY